jgi:hypothetical protein
MVFVIPRFEVADIVTTLGMPIHYEGKQIGIVSGMDDSFAMEITITDQDAIEMLGKSTVVKGVSVCSSVQIARMR